LNIPREEWGKKIHFLGDGEVMVCIFSETNYYTLLGTFSHQQTINNGRRGSLMVSALVPGASGPGSSPGRGHCVVFLGKTLNSHSASLHPGV